MDLSKHWAHRIYYSVIKKGLLVYLPETKAQRAPPLCASQYALVNYACAFTPNGHSNDRVYLFDEGQNYTQVYSPAQRTGDEPAHGHSRNHTHRNEHEGHNHRHQQHEGRNRGHEQHEGRHNHRNEHEGGRNHSHEHEGEHSRGHRYRSGHGRGHQSRNENNDEHEGGHRHRHRRHGHRHHGSSSRGECCKWLSELDDECVCALLVRLPPFLSRQEHKYTVRVGGSCKVSYKCPGRLRL